MSKQMKIISSVFVLFIAGVGGFLLLRTGTANGEEFRSKDTKQFSVPVTNETIQKELVATRIAVQTLREDNERLRAQGTEGAAIKENTPEEVELAATAKELGTDRAAVSGMKVYRERLRSEAKDTVWARQMEADMRTILGNSTMPGSALGKLDCRTSLCSIVVRHESLEKQMLFGEAWEAQQPESSEMMVVPSHTDRTGYQTEIFLVKKGHYVMLNPSSDPGASGLKIPAGFEN